jgi:hypothetical protein
MKITKSQLKQIIKEELEVNQEEDIIEEAPEIANVMNLENYALVWNGIKQFISQPEVVALLTAGSVAAAVARIADLMKNQNLNETAYEKLTSKL